MLQNAPNCTIQKIFSWKHVPEGLNPPSKRLATPRVAISTKKSWPPLANPANAHGLLLKNLVEEIRS